MKSGAYEAAAGSCYAIFRCLAKTRKEHEDWFLRPDVFWTSQAAEPSGKRHPCGDAERRGFTGYGDKVKASSKLVHALNYMRNNWTELIAYRDIGSVLIDNNCCERAVRPFTNLRKSFGGFSSEKGGEVAAAWLTFIETCKLQKKAAFDFFNDFFKKVTEGRSNYELIAQEVLG